MKKQESQKKIILDLFPTMLKLLFFSIRFGGYKGFFDWNISYQRVFEYGEVFKIIKKYKAKSMIDVAGDISIFGCFCARNLNLSVDIVDMGDMEYLKQLKMNLPEHVKKRIILYPNKMASELGDKKYDIITCISAMEHFDNEEDITFMKNCKKMLNNNGILIITSPFTPTKDTIYEYRDINYYKTHGIKQNDLGFYEKKYSINHIKKLINESKLKLEELYFGGEVVNFFDTIFQYSPISNQESNKKMFTKIKRKIMRVFSIAIHLLSPIWPFLFMRKSNEISDFLIDLKREKNGTPDAFILVLQKIDL